MKPITIKVTGKESAGPECPGGVYVNLEVYEGLGWSDDEAYKHGSALVVPDEINGGWKTFGDSPDMWLSWNIIMLIGNRSNVLQHLIEMALDGRIYSRTIPV